MIKYVKVRYHQLNDHYQSLEYPRQYIYYWAVIIAGRMLLIACSLVVFYNLGIDFPKNLTKIIGTATTIFSLVYLLYYPASVLLALLYLFLYWRSGYKEAAIPLIMHGIYLFIMMITMVGPLMLLAYWMAYDVSVH